MLWILLFSFLIGGLSASSGGDSDSAQGQSTSSGSAEATESALCNANYVNELNGTTSQSSDYIDGQNVRYTSFRAMDGNLSTCAHTNEAANSWWRIDLLGIYEISCISIYYKDHHNADISGAVIYIGNSRKDNGTTNPMFKNITEFQQKQWNNFTCDPNMSGRYITVLFPGIHFLVLCDVKIFGTRKESHFKLVQERKNWGDALDYCRDNCMNLATIIDEETQALAELQAKNASTSFVWLGLRYTCTLDFWFWVSDQPLGFSHWKNSSEINQCDVSVAMDKNEDHLWNIKPDSEMYNFICED